MSNTRIKVISGLIWTYGERTLAQLVSLIVTVILARLVMPEEYGVITMATVFITFADTFAISGMGTALIQKKESDQLDYSTVFYFNIVVSLGLYAVLYFVAAPISGFYNMPLLSPVLRVMGLRIPIAAINSVQQAYVSKTLQFKKFFFATLGGTIFSGVLGVVLAYFGFGVWALVAQFMSNTIVDTIVLWFTVKWRPIRAYSHTRMKGLFSFGWKILATSLLINIYSNVQDLIIGKKFTSADLAYSSKGRQFPSLIATNINTSLGKVLFPVLSNEQDSVDKVLNITRKSISVGTYLLTPLLLGLAAVATPFVKIVLTERWLNSVPFLRIMCVSFLLQPIQTSAIQALKALGKSDVYLKLEILKKVVGVAVLLITTIAFHSAMAIFIGSLILEIFATIANFPANRKYYGYSYRDQISDFLPPVLMGSAMVIVVLILEMVLTGVPSGILLIIQILAGGFVYILLSRIFRNKSFDYLKDTIKRILKTRHSEVEA